ncbi:conserved hypothetical protein [Candidatus Terasakiella magnetica]|nr:conserved hypothetical protein [Candidatus Terasakiella magnetica]
MKALKSLVLFLGVLLVVGLGLLGYGLYSKAHLKGGASAGAAPAAVAAVVAEFGTVQVPIPAGARVEQMVTAGERVVLRLNGPAGERILVLDPGQGKVVGAFALTPEPALR